MSFSQRILAGLLSGLAVGVFLGELVAPLEIVADGFVKLLQMTVLPYVTVSIVLSLGTLNAADARRLGLRAGTVLAGLWLVGLIFAFLVPLAFPGVESARFFSTTLVEKRPAFDFIGLYIPANPFHALANNIVPAVVLFSLILGVALIGIERKAVLTDVLAVTANAVARATRFVVRLTPYGIFAIAAHTAGTLSLQDLGRLQVYLASYVVFALLLAVWVLPGLVAALTPFRFGEVLSVTRDALITAFMAGDLFIVLPILIESSKDLVARHQFTGEQRGLPDVIVPASFNFPHTGKLLSLSFVLFAGWFADARVAIGEYPQLALAGFLSFFGSLNAAVPFLLDLFRIPADTFQLFLATGVINSRFGSLLAAVHTVAVALLGTAAVAGAVRLDARRLARFTVITVLLTAASITGLRVLFATVLPQTFAGADLVYGMPPLFPPIEARTVRETPSASQDVRPGRALIEQIRTRGAIRVCVLPNRLPYAFANRKGVLTGFDVEMAHRLGSDLGMRLELVPAEFDQLRDLLARDACDIAMAGIPVTPLRATTMLFSEPYMDETLGFVVRDDLRDQFSTWSKIRALGPMKVAAPDLPYYTRAIRARAPLLQLDLFPSTWTPGRMASFDAFVLPAERGAVYTLLNPKFSVVVPEPDIIKVPLAYPLAPNDGAWATFINTWIELKRRDGTIDALYRHWILGRGAVEQKPRWSVVRNVLHWVR